jgi:hypothetical protein
MNDVTRPDSVRLRSLSSVALGLAAATAISLAPGAAGAQAPPPPGAAPAPGGYYVPAPPPGYVPAPQGYVPAPQGYVPAPAPGGYYAPAPAPGGYYAPAPGPRVITDWEEGQTIPQGYHTTTRIRTGLVVGGAVTFGVLWLTSAFGGAIASDVGSRSGKLLIIPVVGPFTVVPTGSVTADLFLVLDGIAQAGGVAMLVAGIAAPKTVLVRDIAGVTIRPTPMTFGPGSGGFGLRGTF